MHLSQLGSLSLPIVLALASAATPATLHVDANLTTGLDDGSSWSDAFQGADGLQAALAVAVSGDEIFVAQGTYLPTTGASRGASFGLVNGVAIYGSFLGTESTPAERPPFGTAPSVLSGDLAGDDGGGSFGDNSYHIVTTSGTNASAILDGFVVQSGAATGGAGNQDRGGGILCLGNVSPTVRNCRFVGHRSTFGGAAGYVNNGGAPTFTDCSFEDGDGGSFGGAFDIAGGGQVLFDRCLFTGNTAERGGALEIFATNGITVSNCVFSDNVATGSGGGGALWIGMGGNAKVRNSTIVGNGSTVNAVGGLRSQQAPNATVVNCIFWDNTGPGGTQNPGNQVNGASNVDYSIVEGGFNGVGVGNLASDPQFVDIDARDFTPTAASPGIDAGDNTEVPVTSTLDFAQMPRFVDAPGVVDTGVGPAPVVDMGALEFSSSSAWTDLGNGLAGTGGLTPALAGDGALAGGDLATLSLTDALPGGTSFFVLSATNLGAPFKGGLLVPAPDVVIPLTVDGLGEITFSFTWPVGVPAGVSLYYQYWIQDVAGPVGFSASNGLQSTTP